MRLLSSDEYFADAGNNPLGFITRLYDDVLRHDPTPIEICDGAPGSSPVERTQGAPAGPERRPQPRGAGDSRRPGVSHAPEDLSQRRRPRPLGQPPHGTWRPRPFGQLDGRGDRSFGHLLQRWWAGSASAFMTTSIGDLLNRPPTPAELAKDAASHEGDPGRQRRSQARNRRERRLRAPSSVTDEVISFFANYMHATCKELLAAGMHDQLGVPTTAQLSAALTSLATGIDRGGNHRRRARRPPVLREPREHPDGARSRAFTRISSAGAPTNAELSAALAKYTNDPLGHQQLRHGDGRSLPYTGPRRVARLSATPAAGAAHLRDRLRVRACSAAMSGRCRRRTDLLIESIVVQHAGVLRGRRRDRLALRRPHDLHAIDAVADHLRGTRAPQPSATPRRDLAGGGGAVARRQPGVPDRLRARRLREIPHVLGLRRHRSRGRRRPGDTGFLKAACRAAGSGSASSSACCSWAPAAAVFFTLERRRFARIYPERGAPPPLRESSGVTAVL